MPEMTADELRAIARELNAYVKLHPGKHEARSLAIRCGEFAALLAAPTAPRLIEPGSEGIEDRVLRIVSGAPLSRREVRVAGIFALVWFAMDGFWFISTLNHWFGFEIDASWRRKWINSRTAERGPATSSHSRV